MRFPRFPRFLLAGLCGAVLSSCATPPSPFERADTDRDGLLDVSELEKRLAEALHEAGDANGDGTVTHEEWVVVYPQSNKALFNKYDTDGTRGLSIEEATTSLDQEGTFKKLMTKIDTNGDAVIDPQEAAVFHEAMQAADGGNDVQKLSNILK